MSQAGLFDEPHVCHARGCTQGAHPEMPFCRDHAGKLPEPHKKALWSKRPDPGKGTCGACKEYLSTQESPQEWLGLYDLGLAILLKLDFGECGAPESLRDEEDGFCWACGIMNAPHNEMVADKVIAKFGLR